MSKCINCKYARQAGDKKRTDVVGCVVATNVDRLPKDFTGKQYHQGYWHTAYVGDADNCGSLIYGVLVDSEEQCSNFEERL